MRVTFVLPHAGMTGGIRVLAIYADKLYRRGHFVTVISIPQIRNSYFAKFKSLVRHGQWPRDQAPEPSYFDNAAVPLRVLQTARPVIDDDVPDGDIVLATY